MYKLFLIISLFLYWCYCCYYFLLIITSSIALWTALEAESMKAWVLSNISFSIIIASFLRTLIKCGLEKIIRIISITFCFVRASSTAGVSLGEF